MNRITKGWNFIRLLRLALGLGILVQGIVAAETVSILLGVAFAGMAVANVGCCGVSGCAVNSPSARKKTEAISYDEVQ